MIHVLVHSSVVRMMFTEDDLVEAFVEHLDEKAHVRVTCDSVP